MKMLELANPFLYPVIRPTAKAVCHRAN